MAKTFGLPLGFAFKTDEGMAVTIGGKICPGFFKIGGPELFHRSELIGISRTGPDDIDLDIGEVGDQLVLLPISDDLVDIVICDLDLGEVVFPGILKHI